MGRQYVASGYREILNYKELIEPYLKNQKNDEHIHFLSVNTYKTEAGKSRRVFPAYKVFKSGGKRIGLIGITSLTAQDGVDKNRPIQPWLKGVELREPLPIIEKEIITVYLY